MRSRFSVCVLMFALVLSRLPYAGTVDTLMLQGESTGKTMRYLVIKPDDYAAKADAGMRFPVVYLLHCAGCDDHLWNTQDYADVDAVIDGMGFLAVAPYDGGTGGDYRWWLDSPVRPESQLATYVADELKAAVDTLYPTKPDRANTALCGHSMGGFGSFHLLIEHSDVFGIAVPIKAAVDLSMPLNPNWPGDFNLAALLGATLADSGNWNRVNVLRNAHRLVGRDVRLRYYDGVDDTWFHEENARLDTLLDSLGVRHERIILREGHFEVTPELMRRVFGYLDTLFSSTATVEPPGRRGEATTPRPSRAAAPGSRWNGTACFDIRGARWTAGANNGAGIRVRRLARGTVLEVSL